MTVAGKRVMSDLMLREDDLCKCEEDLESVNEKRLHVIGQTDLMFSCGRNACTETIVFCEDIQCDNVYISLHACRNLGVVHENFPLPMKRAAKNTLINAIKISAEQPSEGVTVLRGVDATPEDSVTSIVEEYSEVFGLHQHHRVVSGIREHQWVSSAWGIVTTTEVLLLLMICSGFTRL